MHLHHPTGNGKYQKALLNSAKNFFIPSGSDSSNVFILRFILKENNLIPILPESLNLPVWAPPLSGAGPGEAGRPAGLSEDLPAAVLHPPGGARAAPHPRQQQVSQQQAAAPHDLRLALPAAQGLRGPGLQVQRPPAAGSHHRQVRHPQEDRPAGEQQTMLAGHRHSVAKTSRALWYFVCFVHLYVYYYY